MYKRIRNVLCALALSVMSLAPAIAMPGIARAASCDITSQGGGGGSGTPVTTGAFSAAIPDTTAKVGVEVTPVTMWPANSDGLFSFVSLAKTDCSDASANVNIQIDANHVLTATLYDNNHTGAYVQGSAFANAGSGVTWASSADYQQTMTYTIPTFPNGTAQLVSVDLSNTGYVDIYLKQGNGTDTRLGSMVLTSGITKFLNDNGTGASVFLSGTDPSWTTCNQLAAYEGQIRVLADGVALDLTPDSTTYDTCPHLEQSTYNGTTKTYDAKVVTVAQSGSPEDAQVLLAPSTGNNFFNILTSTATQSGYFSDYFNSSTSASQGLYFSDYFSTAGQGYASGDDPIVASATFDLSNGDIDATTVVLDTNKTTFSAVAHNLAGLTKDKTFSLYVPYRDGDKSVGVCPGAADLNAVTTSCDKLYYIGNGQSKTSADAGGIPANVTVKATIVTINGLKYWEVDGLTGTGGFSSTVDPNAAAATKAPDTGFALVANKSFSALAVSTVAALAIAGIAHRLKPAHKR